MLKNEKNTHVIHSVGTIGSHKIFKYHHILDCKKCTYLKRIHLNKRLNM